MKRYSQMVFREICALIALCLLCSCNREPPSVTIKSDIERLPVSQQSVWARALPDSDIPSLERLRDLDDLDFFAGCAVEKASITDEGLARLSRLSLPQLHTLALGYCENITDAGLAYVGQMHTVTQLILAGSPQITDAGLPKLLAMKNLTYLDLRGCLGITDRGLLTLATKTNWQEISLGGCSNVTNAGVARLQAALPNAKVRKDDIEWSESKCDKAL
jgi:hypothetical protein